MKLFQNGSCYPSYLKRLNSLSKKALTFEDRRSIFLSDSYGGVHTLLPVLNKSSEAFFTNGDDKQLQILWATEKNMPLKSSLKDILLAQLEEFKAEVFYNMDPVNFDNKFMKSLPGCVKKNIIWWAAPSRNLNFNSSDILVCNFPEIIDSYRHQGLRAEYFAPAYDPIMEKYSINEKRIVDILFVGGYTQYHQKRAQILELIASLRNKYNIAFNLDCSRLVRLAESKIGFFPYLNKFKRPKDIRAVSSMPTFGLDLYQAISSAKIVINCAVDISPVDRGNMRCFEACGCGALLVSDEGNYPTGFINNKTMMTFENPKNAAFVVQNLLDFEQDRIVKIAKDGNTMIKNLYSKDRQWNDFLKIVQ